MFGVFLGTKGVVPRVWGAVSAKWCMASGSVVDAPRVKAAG